MLIHVATYLEMHEHPHPWPLPQPHPYPLQKRTDNNDSRKRQRADTIFASYHFSKVFLSHLLSQFIS